MHAGGASWLTDCVDCCAADAVLSATLTLRSDQKNVAVNVRQAQLTSACSCKRLQIYHVKSLLAVLWYILNQRHESAVADLFAARLQLPCIPPRAKLITVGLPVSSTAIPFLTAARIIRRSLRLDGESCWIFCVL